MAGRKLRGRRRAEVGGSGGEPGCDSQRGGAGAVGDGGAVVRETDGKRGRWRIRTQIHSNPNFFKSDGHGKNVVSFQSLLEIELDDLKKSLTIILGGVFYHQPSELQLVYFTQVYMIKGFS